MTNSVEQPLNTDQKTPTSRHQKEKGQSKVTKKSLGGGLTKIVRNGETISYEFRMMHEGTSHERSIGSAKDLSEEQARVKAKKYRQIILSKKDKDGIEKLSANLAMQSIPCFKNHEHARNFIKDLYQIAPVDSYRFTDGNLEPLELELHGIIWLMLLLPLNMEDLLELEIPDIHRRRVESYLTLRRAEKNSPDFDVYLPDTSIKIFDALEETHERGNNRGKLFPLLNRLSKSERKTKIQQVLSKIHPAYVIDANKFIAFFEFTANKFSYFRSEFIKDYAKKRHLQNEWGRINSRARWNLATWWEIYLQQEIHFLKFPNVDLSILGTRRPESSSINRRQNKDSKSRQE